MKIDSGGEVILIPRNIWERINYLWNIQSCVNLMEQLLKRKHNLDYVERRLEIGAENVVVFVVVIDCQE